MPLRVASCFTYRTSADSPWTDAHHSVNQFVDALKGRPVRGFGHVLVNRTQPKRRIEAANAQQASEWFGEMGATIVAEEESADHIALVPVPNCDCVEAAEASKVAVLAAEIAGRCRARNAVVADVIRWNQVMPSASHGEGPRDPSVLYPQLRLTARLPPNRTLVLVDDVLTTGGHLRACAALLRQNGGSVNLAVCGARADAIPQADPFQRRIDELEDFTP